jgi:hypothetical protein
MGSFPEIERFAAPWALTGSGYILMFRLDKPFAEACSFIPPDLKARYTGGIGTVMFVDYHYSDAGPYRELLFIPGMFRFHRKEYFSITKIYVSTMESVVSGRENWGIPKELAQFEIMKEDDSTERIRVLNDGTVFTELVLRTFSGKMPVTTSLCPPAWRTLAHDPDGKILLTTLRARGWAKPARLVTAVTDPAMFPDFSRGRIVLAAKIPDFFMVFPKAEIL